MSFSRKDPISGGLVSISSVAKFRAPLMLSNIDPTLYSKFKAEGYRIKRYKSERVMEVSEIVQLAYLDVNRTLGGIQTEQSSCFKQTAARFVENFLRFPLTNQEDFDKLHRQACEECCSHSAPKGATIHYGQAQKLINMSLKYVYNEFALGGTPSHFGFRDGSERFFHLPIDSQIRRPLVEICQFAAPKGVPWSKWSYEQYMAFQGEVRRRLKSQYKPLEVDYILWNAKNSAILEALSALFD